MATARPAKGKSAMENPLGISYFVVTGKGERSHNEDYYGHACYENVVTFVVSDGVGSQDGGSMASEMVVEMIRQNAKFLAHTDMMNGYQAIEQAVLERQRQCPRYKKMAATVAELRIDASQQKAIWGHFGDSRIYWIRNSQIIAVTGDHSVVKRLVTAGLISEREALVHPKKHILLGAFGMAGDIEPEVLDNSVYLAEGDAFLLCTDGLWSCIADHDILDSLQISSSVEEWIKRLESHAKNVQLKDKDNYTAIGVWFTSAADRTIRMS